MISNKNELQNGDIVTLRNGDRLMYNNEEFVDLSDDFDNSLADIKELNNDMTFSDRYRFVTEPTKNDIIFVQRPIGYECVFERKDNVKEMTVEEISKILGYEVKIVKGEK